MYQEFIDYAREIAEQEQRIEETHRMKRDNAAILQEALEFFGKREEFDTMVYTHGRRQRLKLKFSGTKVIQWTGLSNNGAAVGAIMRAVRLKFTEDEILATEEDCLKATVLQMQQDLGFIQSDVHVTLVNSDVSIEETVPEQTSLASDHTTMTLAPHA
jgi:hypothetical protein